MKRKGKESNTIDSEKRKKQKVTEPSQDEEVNEAFERRRQELFELVSKENELYGSQKNKNAKTTTCKVDYSSSESEDDLSEQERERFEKYRLKEKQREVEKVEVIYMKRALKALKILETDAKKSKKKPTDEEKRLFYLTMRCNNQHSEHKWDSVMYIVKNIRACILTRNWNNLTHFLLLLLKYSKTYVPFVKQVAHLNFMVNQSDSNGEILNEFHKLL